MSSKRHHALTLLEVLVVIAIVAVIVGIMLPAIMRARTAATRVDCANRLHQIGVALHAYLADYACFPPRAITSPGLDFAGPWNEHVPLLPYLEQKQMYNALNIGLMFKHPANSTVARQSLDVFLCPADGVTSPGAHGFGSYAASIGSGLWADGMDSNVDASLPYDGIFYGLRGIKSAECTDGLTQTAAFCEVIHGGTQGELKGTEVPVPTHGWEYHFPHVTPPTQRELIRICVNLAPNHPLLFADRVGTPWLHVGKLNYNHLLTPNHPRCIGGGFGDASSVLTASSRHTGIVHLLLADGHVSPISNNIDQTTWRSLGSRNGGETVDRSF